MKEINKIKKETPFRVPENYFEEVNRKIISSTSGKVPVQEKHIGIKRFRNFYLAAAAVAAFALIGILSVRISRNISESRMLANEMESSLPELMYSEIDVFMIEETAGGLTLPDEGSGTSAEEIVDYLLLDNIELTDIYELL